MKTHVLAVFGLLLVATTIAASAEEESGSLIAPGEKVQKLAGVVTELAANSATGAQ